MRLRHAVLLALFVSCRSDGVGAPPREAERHASLHDPGLRDTDLEGIELPYQRIELVASGQPAFLLERTGDGSVSWEIRFYSEPAEAHRALTGTCGAVEFGRLCWFVEKLGLERLAGGRVREGMPAPSTLVRLVEPGGAALEFRNTGSAPIEVTALLDMVELVARRHGWPTGVEREPRIDAVVLEVQPEARLVVLDKGRRDDVVVGTRFDVTLGSTYKGQVRVEVVRETTCTARILGERNEMASGDSATTML